MMLTEPEPRVLVVTSILVAIRDGYDLIQLRQGKSFWYEMFGRHQGQEFDLIGPSNEAAQWFPAVLAGFSQPERVWGRLARWGRRKTGGAESGSFLFSVGAGSIPVEYRVRWEKGAVAELEIAIPLATEAEAAAAHQELQQHVRTEQRGDASD